MIKVFSQEFHAAVYDVLETLEDGFYLTREQLLGKLGLPAEYGPTIPVLFESGGLPEYEAVKSRGIRRRKGFTKGVRAGLNPVVPVDAPEAPAEAPAEATGAVVAA